MISFFNADGNESKRRPSKRCHGDKQDISGRFYKLSAMASNDRGRKLPAIEQGFPENKPDRDKADDADSH
jgi:hypothetical protein